MAKLDYCTIRNPSIHDSTWPAVFVLLFLPFAAGAWTALSAMHWLDEPFMILDARDIAIFGGAPFLNVCALAVWCWLAKRKQFHWFSYLPAIVWFAVMTYLSISLLIPYFNEPWNH